MERRRSPHQSEVLPFWDEQKYIAMIAAPIVIQRQIASFLENSQKKEIISISTTLVFHSIKITRLDRTAF